MYHQVWEQSQTRMGDLGGITARLVAFPAGKTKSYANMRKILLSTRFCLKV